MKKPNQNNPVCPCCSNKPTIKIGKKKNKFRTTQRYLCKSCKKTFIDQHQSQKSKTHSIKTILTSISDYNLGMPLRQQKIPSSTIHNWVKNFNLPLNRLRNRVRGKNPDEIIIKKRFIHHQQPFLYQYHKIKLNFATKFPGLIKYLKYLYLPKGIFENSQRISKTNKELKDPPANVGISKTNYAVKLAKLALTITKDNKERHDIIENFMLINDTATIATEIPIYLKETETKSKPLTGHIDILQIRYNKIYILDYKPEPVNKQQTISQLLLYRKALSRRTFIPKNKIKLAFFNDKGYCEIN